MKEIEFVIWQEGKYYVSQCLNVNVSSFGETIDEATANLKEAVELYFENEAFEERTLGDVLTDQVCKYAKFAKHFMEKTEFERRNHYEIHTCKGTSRSDNTTQKLAETAGGI